MKLIIFHHLNVKNILFLIFLIIAIILVSGDNQDRIKKAQFIGRYFFLPYTASISYFKSLSKITSEKNELKNKLLSIQSQNQFLKEELSKYERISDLTNSKFFQNKKIQTANVIGTGSFINFETLMISVGKSHKIQKNMPVISINGLVGKIITVYPTYSVVQTFCNRYFRMGAIDERSRINGIVETDLSGKIYFRKIKVGSNIKSGDKIITSRLSSIYPHGIPLGKIIKIEETSNGLFMKAEIEPFVNIAKTEEVGIVIKTEGETGRLRNK